MKTITFYSYKGGVGRSLTLANIAMRLSQLKKTVCVVDFDLDAPGLRFKFTNDYLLEDNEKKGLVDYIYQFSQEGELPENISDFTNKLIPKNVNSEPIIFISAGNINSSDYWKKLSMIRWADMFYSKHGHGIKFFLDLKAKIEKEFQPDYLLIDSRTGITDISGITLRILADEIIILAVNNKENIFGTKKILQSFINESYISKKKIKLRFVLTRLPYSESTQDKEKEFQVIQSVKKELQDVYNEKELDFFVIHADKDLGEKESLVLGSSIDEKARLLFNKKQHETETMLSRDYLTLFDKITEGDLFQEAHLLKIKEAEEEFANAMNQKDLTKKLVYLNKVIKLDSNNYRYLIERGTLFWTLEMTQEAIDDFLDALKLKNSDLYAQYALGLLSIKSKEYENAVKYLTPIIQILPEAASYKAYALRKLNRNKEALDFLNQFLGEHPDMDTALNSRADLLRINGDFDNALKDIYKAIELNPSEPMFIATLAEIRASSKDIEGFYLSLTIALSKGLTALQMSAAKEVYEMFINDKRFLELMGKYQIDVNSVFSIKES
ncbi:KGGVGR-motif variant AAA ATPase [Mucilaginibacter sp. E4BP6]|uniref:KGGVGR-motif variant AAA ATPase n=1 Tax=Mucilaginibacter sp. E4BP6 TaxID=2723089 RepID=UPI0015CD4917|nr:tetratricopeptide repeat protein [Mucilaginibacter sp. E4BP6]NYE66666.1 MinD-like ATPase involved in chromosome partitioning or flagellar assembly/Flp pilus assembly protein TadD [Mucilaginibacter sp. E4BP6]